MPDIFHIDIAAMIRTIGYVGIFVVVLFESGIIFGIFLPGDSLLFISGLLAAEGYLSLPVLIVLYIVAGFLGGAIGYWSGRWAAITFFREDARFFKKRYLDQTHDFYERYGAKAVVLARFVPIVRTLMPVFAGAGAMTYAKFLRFNFFGAMLWGTIIPSLGFLLGRAIPNSEHLIVPIAIFIVVLSILPSVFEFIRERRKTQAL